MMDWLDLQRRSPAGHSRSVGRLTASGVASREYARGLSDWLVSGTVTAVHASEFSVSSDEGFAGTADA